MTDIYTVPELTWTAGNLSVANLNQYVRDNMQALRAGLTDSSADTDIVQAVKSGTLAARSGVAHSAGRMYYTTDTAEVFVSDGTSWRHASGSGAYDDLLRANNTNLNTNNPYQPAGSPWTEEAGDWDILTNQLRLTGAADGYATLQTSALLTRSYRMKLDFTVQATLGSINLAAVPKFVNTSNAILVELVGGAPGVLQIFARIAGVNTPILASLVTTPTVNMSYRMDIDVFGSQIEVILTNQDGNAIILGARHARINDPAFATATKVGVHTNNANERFNNIAVWF